MKTHIKLSPSVFLLQNENLLLIQKKETKDTLKLEPQLILILKVLWNMQNEVVLKEQLINIAWNGNIFVGRNALRKNIYKLRKLLEKNELTDEIMIVTVPKRGYKLKLMKPNLTQPKRSRPIRKIMFFTTAALLLLFIFLKASTEEREDILLETNSHIEPLLLTRSSD